MPRFNRFDFIFRNDGGGKRAQNSSKHYAYFLDSITCAFGCNYNIYFRSSKTISVNRLYSISSLSARVFSPVFPEALPNVHLSKGILRALPVVYFM
jgi:hypothetical protein